MSAKALGKKREVLSDCEPASRNGVNGSNSATRTPQSGSRHASPSQKGRASGSNRAPFEPRNFDRVLYGNFDIKTWYYSPYPIAYDDDASHKIVAGASNSGQKRNLSPSPLRAAGHPSKRVKNQHHPLSGDALSSLSADASAAAESPSSRTSSPTGARKREPAESTRMLWVCDGCFKYMKAYNDFAMHKKTCTYTHPPGRKVYQRGAHIIWEVDGAAQKLYCQNLSLFGKLFIDHKTIYFDVEPFLFYILTDAASAKIDHPLGYFSKEKLSYDDYNLACIITFPPYQRKSFGTLMIEFSYVLSAAQDVPGTPERPLSDLGLKGYLSFWTAVLLRALQFCLDGSTLPKTSSNRSRTSNSTAPQLMSLSQGSSDSETLAIGSLTDTQQEAARKLKVLQMRCKLLSLPYTAMQQRGLTELQQAAGSPKPQKKIRLKGWAGSTPTRSPRIHSSHKLNGDLQTQTNAEPQPLHSALSLAHLDEPVTLETTLEAIAALAHLRPDDVVLALTEAGLLGPQALFLNADDPVLTTKGVSNEQILLFTREAINDAMIRFNVRPAVLDENFVLI